MLNALSIQKEAFFTSDASGYHLRLQETLLQSHTTPARSHSSMSSAERQSEDTCMQRPDCSADQHLSALSFTVLVSSFQGSFQAG